MNLLHRTHGNLNKMESFPRFANKLKLQNMLYFFATHKDSKKLLLQVCWISKYSFLVTKYCSESEIETSLVFYYCFCKNCTRLVCMRLNHCCLHRTHTWAQRTVLYTVKIRKRDVRNQVSVKRMQALADIKR